MAYILTHDLFTKHTAVVLNQHSETFTLLQSIDNDISHIYCILIPEGHVVYTDKSPESHSFTKGERRSKWEECTYGELPKDPNYYSTPVIQQ